MYNGRTPIPRDEGEGPSWIAIIITAALQIWPVSAILLFFKLRAKFRNRRLNKYRMLSRLIGPNLKISLKTLKRMSGMDRDELRKRLEEMISRNYLGPEAYIDYGQDALVLDIRMAYVPVDDSKEGFDFSLDFDDLANSLKNAAKSFADVVAEGVSNISGSFADSAKSKAEAKRWAKKVAEEEKKRAAEAAKEAAERRAEEERKARVEKTAPEEKKAQEKKKDSEANDIYSMPDFTDNEEILKKLKLLNDQIANESVSGKIDRIAQLTNDINKAVASRPGKQNEVRKFLNYYLPTTIKLLGSYALLERQSYKGENIKSSMANIDKMLDTLIAAYEKQLDQLFASEAMDISSDIKVLETMIAADGLTSQGMQMKI